MPCSIRDEFILDKLIHACFVGDISSCNFVIQGEEYMERGSRSAQIFFPHWHLHMKLSPRRIAFMLFLASLSLSHPNFFLLCCSQSLSWSGKSEVIGFWIKESKKGWKQALIHFTLSGRTGWQETLGNSDKRAFALNFPANNQRHHLGSRCFY